MIFNGIKVEKVKEIEGTNKPSRKFLEGARSESEACNLLP